MRNRMISLLSLMLAISVSWAQTPAPSVSAPADASAMLARLREIPRQLEGWQLTDVIQTCDQTCLPQHFPVDAQTVLSYQYLWSVTAAFMPPNPQQPIVADVFAMADDGDAFGLFARARNDQAVTAGVRPESYWTGDQLHIWRGRFYLRLTPKTNDELLRAGTLAVGEAIAARLPLPDKPPLMMRLMPEGRAKPQALRFYRQNVLGQPTLADGLVNEYLQDGKPLTFVLLRAQDEAAAGKLLTATNNLLRQGSAATPLGSLGKQAFVMQSPQYGLSYTMREGRYVALALGVLDRDTAEGLLRLAATNIRIVR
ncbi:MAG: DUF6599 family protein [Armatimonadia bacterium]